MGDDSDLRLLEMVERELGKPVLAPHQAAALAANLSQVADISLERFETLASEYRARIHSAGLDDVLVRQLTYAARLAAAPGDLIFEELHKLLSLCDEVFSLQLLGFTAPDGLLADFEASVRSRFSQQRSAARMAAEDRVREWKNQRWWYATLLTF